MNALLVTIKHNALHPENAAKYNYTRGQRAAIEQHFYEEHGSGGAVFMLNVVTRISQLKSWVKLKCR